MKTRRRFLHAACAAVPLALLPRSLMRAQQQLISSPSALVPHAGETLITILHTNDTHSQIDPLPDNDPNAGRGGVARRATLVRRVRAENPHTLLVDAGDAFQGTPYFNLFRGEVEYRAMSAIGYDVVTLGNHDFDNGVEALAAAMKFARFDFVSANYDVRGTAIAERVKPYAIREVGGVRIGLFGLGVKLDGLNTPNSFRDVKYLNPVSAARDSVRILRERERCAMVVCLSHLGYYPNPQGDEIGDSQVAAQVDGIDFIASGHTHTFMEQPVMVRQPGGRETVIFQVGKSGIYVGRVDFLVRDRRVQAARARLLDVRDEKLA